MVFISKLSELLCCNINRCCIKCLGDLPWHVDCPSITEQRSALTLRKGHQQHAASQIMVSGRDYFYFGTVPRLDSLLARTDLGRSGFAGRERTSRVEFGRA